MSHEKLHDYFDGELPADEAERFERALAGDPELSGHLRELRELDAALELLPGHRAPADFTARVLRASRRRLAPLVLRLAVPLAAAAALVLAVVLARPEEANGTSYGAPDYVWEADVETYGSLALTDMEDLILEELEAS